MSQRSFSPLLLLLLWATPAEGQVRIVGRVIDDLTEAPIPQAMVAVMAPDGSVISRTQTDEAGAFEFEVRRVRGVRILARQLSYADNTSPVLHFDGRRFFQVEVRLDPQAILLAPLEVLAWSEKLDGALLEGFQRRLQTGLGVYITRDLVERRKPAMVTDLLREIPGVQVSGGGPGAEPTVRMARAGMANCATQIFVDGFLINRRAAETSGANPMDFRIDDVVSPGSVEGIEVYRGLSTVPAEFLNPDAECGVIAIWTRRGGRLPAEGWDSKAPENRNHP
jgi:hypothetical protein